MKQDTEKITAPRARAAMRSVHPELIALALALLLILSGAAACGRDLSLVGRWELTSSQEAGYVPGMVFEFTDGGVLYITPGSAPLPSDEQASLMQVKAGDRLTYTSTRTGTLRLLLKLENDESISFSMTYDVTGDQLTITDRDGYQLVFQKIG